MFLAKYCLEWQRKITKSCQDIWYRTGHLSSVSLRAYLVVQPYSIPAGTINRQSERKVTYQNVAWNVNSSYGPGSRTKRHAYAWVRRPSRCVTCLQVAVYCFKSKLVLSRSWFRVPLWSLRPHFSPILENCCPSRH